LLVATSCATPYQPERRGAREHSWMQAYGGYSDTRIDANTESVAYGGNGFTPRRTVELYLLYRCAEVTHQSGYDYFVVLNPSTDATQSSVTTPSSFNATTVISGNSLATRATYFPGDTITFTSYGAQTLIKMFAGTKPEDVLAAYDASEVIQYMGPSVGRDGTLTAVHSKASATRPRLATLVTQTDSQKSQAPLSGQLVPRQYRQPVTVPTSESNPNVQDPAGADGYCNTCPL